MNTRSRGSRHSSRSRYARMALLAREAMRCYRPGRWIACALVALAAGGASLGFALNQDSASGPVGLQGIWPDFPPRSLSVDQFSQLDHRWAEWSEAAAIDVANLYSLQDKTVEQQYELLAKVRERVDVLEKAMRDPAYAMIHEELTDVWAPLDLHVDLFRASLDLVSADATPAAKKALPAAKDALADAMDAVRSDLKSIPNGSAWLPYLDLAKIEKTLSANEPPTGLEELAAKLDPAAQDLSDAQTEFLRQESLQNLAQQARTYAALVRISKNGADSEALRQALASLIEAIDYHEASPTDETAAAIRGARDDLRLAAGPAAEALDDLIRMNYLNYNLRLVADASFLSKLTSVHDVTVGPVRDCFMGANIFGNQRTKTNANLVFIPSNERAQFKLVLDGVANSWTTAYAEQATVNSVGRHYFHATKPVSFNGDRFAFSPARVSVDPHIRHTGISTKFDHIFFGLFKGLIQRKAMKEANERLPAGRAHAADELRAKLLPQFNSEVEENFAELNREIAIFDAALFVENLAPAAERTRTTSDRFLFDAAVRAPEELSGSAPNIGSTRGEGFTLQIHESLLNNMADRWDLAGQSLTEMATRELLEIWFTDLLGREISFDDESGKPADPSIITFSETDPIRFNIQNGNVVLILRAGIETEDGEKVPPQVVEVPLELTMVDGDIKVERGTVVVSPLERPRSRARQIARAGIMRNQIEKSIPNGTIDGTFTIEQEGREPVAVTIERIDAQAGWLTLFGR